jgi:hypothetical protein
LVAMIMPPVISTANAEGGQVRRECRPRTGLHDNCKLLLRSVHLHHRLLLWLGSLHATPTAGSQGRVTDL